MTVKLKRMSSHDRMLVVIAALDIEAGALGRNKPDGLEVVVSGVGKVAAQSRLSGPATASSPGR